MLLNWYCEHQRKWGREGKHAVRIAKQKSWANKTIHCAFQEPKESGVAGAQSGVEREVPWVEAIDTGRSQGRLEPFILPKPSTILEIISSGFTFRLQASYLFLLELWAWHAPHLGQLFFPHYWHLIHSSVPSSGPSSTTKNKNSKHNHQHGAQNGTDQKL